MHAPRLLIPDVVDVRRTIRVGQEAPEFTLPGAAAGTIETHGLSEYTDRGWAVVLVFYPFDFHPACTDRWCSVRDADWRTLLDDVVVLGVDADGACAHREYADEHNIQFPQSSDTDGRVSRAYGGLTDEFENHRDVPSRATFVVAPDRTVQFAWSARSPDDRPDRPEDRDHCQFARAFATCRGRSTVRSRRGRTVAHGFGTTLRPTAFDSRLYQLAAVVHSQQRPVPRHRHEQ